MAYSLERAQYEAHLARAHRAIANAEKAAEAMGSSGAEWDCHLIAVEIVRLANDSLAGKNRRSRSAVDVCA